MYSDIKKCWICVRIVIILTCTHIWWQSSSIACHVSQCTLWHIEQRMEAVLNAAIPFIFSFLKFCCILCYILSKTFFFFFMDFSALPIIFTGGIYTTSFIYILSISVKVFQRRRTNKRGKCRRRRKGGVSAFVTQNNLHSLSK